MKTIVLIILLITSLLGQWKTYQKHTSWTNKNWPIPVADWRINYGVTTSDTGTIVIKSLVTEWKSTNSLYAFKQSNSTYRPIYSYSDSGIYFDGNDDYLSVPASESQAFNPTNTNFTIASWFYYNGDNSTYQSIYSRNYYIRFDINTNSKIYFQLYDGSTVYGVTGITALGIGWHFAAVVRAGNSSDILRIYLDGIKDRELVKTTKLTINLSSIDIRLGLLSSSNLFKNRINEILYYDRVLNDGQVEHIYNIGIKR